MRTFPPQSVCKRVVLTGRVPPTACHGRDRGVVADYQWWLEATLESDVVASCDAREHAFNLVRVRLVEEAVVEGGALGPHGLEMLEGLSYGVPD